MQVISWSQFLSAESCANGQFSTAQLKTAMTIGIFDGVHRGHRALIERVVSHNSDLQSGDIKSGDLQSADSPSAACVPAVITFRENHKTAQTADIQSFEQKLEIFEQLGVQLTIVIDFIESFRQMKGIEFLELLLKHGNVGFFAVGKSFRCGYQLDTDAQAIRDFFVSHNIQVEIADEVMEGELPVSSSRIRAAIANGDFQLAESMLGRPVGYNAQT